MATNHDRTLNEVKGVLRFPLVGDGDDVPFVDIHVWQKCYTHNEIKATIKYKAMDAKGWMSDPTGVIDTLLNNLMVVRLFHAKMPDDIVYHAAIITEVNFENNRGAEGDIVLKGLSPSVMLAAMRSAKSPSWGGKGLISPHAPLR